MALYFLHGSLPWQGLKAPDRQEKYQRVLEQKQTTSVEELCADLPAEFATYMNYVRQPSGRDKPDYVYLRNLFRGLFRRSGFEYDHVFDWTIREFERLSSIAYPVRKPETNVTGQTEATPRTERGRRAHKGIRRTRAQAEEG